MQEPARRCDAPQSGGVSFASMCGLNRQMLDRAALAALRGWGRVEPNPMVGCAIGLDDGSLLAIGHHRRVGGPHAEIDALERCRALGREPRGATCWVTLEPCAHHGRTPPCADALIEAGVRRVVIAQRDPSEVSRGGAERLAGAGVQVESARDSALASAVALPFVKRTTLGMPWVIAKWAQTLDGHITTPPGESRWISNETSRRSVHRTRAMVGGVLTAIGTIRTDDPRLTVRGVAARRAPLRIAIDPRLEIGEDSALVGTIDQAGLLIATLDAGSAKARRLEKRGALVLDAPSSGDGEIDLHALLRILAGTHGIATILCEAGPGLLGRLVAQRLVDEAIVYIAPMLLSGAPVTGPLSRTATGAVPDNTRWILWRRAVRGGDVMLRYVRASAIGDAC